MSPATKKPRLDACTNVEIIDIEEELTKCDNDSIRKRQNAEWDRILTLAPLTHVYGGTGVFTTPLNKAYVTEEGGGYAEMDSLCGTTIKAFISGSESNCFAISEVGLFSWGCDNNSGQLGLGRRVKEVIPLMARRVGGSLALTGKKIIQLAASQNHALVLTEDGGIHSFGNNDRGQLGLGDRRKRYIPEQVGYLGTSHKVVQIAVIKNMSFILTEMGEIISWGSDNKKESSVGSICPHVMAQFPKQNHVVFRKIVSSKHKIIALSQEGNVYEFDSTSCNPAFLYGSTTFQNVVDIAGDPKFETCVLTTKNGEFYSWTGWKHKPLLRQDIGSMHQIWMKYPETDSKEIIADDSRLINFNQGNQETLDNATIGERHGQDADKSLQSPDFLYGQNLAEIERESEPLYLINGDVEFLVENKKIRAHRATLMKLNAHFKQLLQNIGKHNDTGMMTIEIVNTSFTAFSALLHYIYLQKVVYSGNEHKELCDLMQLAQRFGEAELKQKCQTHLLETMTGQNLFTIFRTAVSINDVEMQKFALDYILQNKVPLKYLDLERHFENDLITYAKFTKDLIHLKLLNAKG